MPLEPGTRLGAYEIVALIGAGGMGEVYRARDPRLARDVAVKVLPAAFSSDPERMRRFEQEARATAALNHPNILAVHDIGTHEAQPYVVAELLEGETLDQRIQGAALPVRKALDYALQLARGLAAAHERGVVHRDLKPANIFITTDGRVKILDFGLAKLTEPEPAAASSGTMLPTIPPATTPGLVLGTIGYMSPEQVRGLPADHRSDIFAFGAILYETLSGRRAFAGATNADTMTAILKEDPPDLPAAERQIPPALSRIVDRCIEKHPGSRFQSAGDLAFAIEALSSPSATTTTAIEPSPSAPAARASRVPWIVAALSGAALVATAAVAIALYAGRTTAKPEPLRFTVPAPEGWALVGGNLRLAVSPDGRRVAFVAQTREGKSQLWVRALDSLAATPLNGTESAVNPFWSPDSRSVAFVAGGNLKKIDVTGGPAVTLCDISGMQGGTWSPAGVIVFGSGGTLFRVPAAGGVAVPISKLGTNESGHSGPSFLPDGRHFIYSVSGAQGTSSWTNYVGALDSTDRVQVAGVSWPKAVYTQGHMLFPRETTLMAQPFDARRFTITGEAFPVAEQIQTLPGFGVGLFSVSENGVLAYQTGSDANTSQLAWMDRTGKILERFEDRSSYSDVQLSPDGKRAFVNATDPARRTRDLWLFDVVRGLRSRFTFDPVDELTTVWSPDGSRVVFNSRRKGRMDLYLKAANNSGDEELLFADATDKTPVSWSPDGQHLLFLTGGQTQPDLWVLPMTGDRKPQPFARNPFAEVAGQFSPDGRWIAYSSNESGRFEVYVAPFPGPGGKWQVSTAGGGNPRWRGDGQELFFIIPGQGRVMSAAVSGRGSAFEVRSVTPLFSFVAAGLRFNYDVTRDGQRFLVNTGLEASQSSPLTIVVNWLEGVKK